MKPFRLAIERKLFQILAGAEFRASVRCASKRQTRKVDVPSLIRFLIVCGILGGLAYGGMYALSVFVEPQEREMRVKIPSKRINR